MSGIAPHARRGRLVAAAAGVLVAGRGAAAGDRPAGPAPATATAGRGRGALSPVAARPQPPSQHPGRPRPARHPARPATPISGPVLARSVPVALDIPQLKVRSDLLQLGLNPDQTVQVPPLARDSRAGWYKYSPTPGQLGPSVILGHVDSAEYGPGIFFRLGALRPGSTLTVTRADRTTAVFRVDRVVSYPEGPLSHPRGVRQHRQRAAAADHLRRQVRPQLAQLREQHRRLRHPGIQPSGLAALASDRNGHPLMNTRQLATGLGALALLLTGCASGGGSGQPGLSMAAGQSMAGMSMAPGQSMAGMTMAPGRRWRPASRWPA